MYKMSMSPEVREIIKSRHMRNQLIQRQVSSIGPDLGIAYVIHMTKSM